MAAGLILQLTLAARRFDPWSLQLICLLRAFLFKGFAKSDRASL